MSELKKCPSCKGEAILQGYRYKWVECKECGMSSGTFENRDKAIKAWNTRKPVEDVVEALEELAHDNPMVTDNYILRREAIRIVKEIMV